MIELPEPSWLKMPDGESFDDDAPTKWAWMAHGYDTGMEPFFSADQLRQVAKAVLELAARIADTEAENGPWNDGACRDTCAEIASKIRALKAISP